jgi:VWFA-related protein
MGRIFFTIVASVTLGAAALAQQTQLFRSAVLTVPIHATVVDAKGRLVPDLLRSDFEVFDNGKPTELTNFVAEVQPISVVTAIDMSGSMTGAIGIVKDAAESFMLRLLPHDRARIVTFDDRTRWSPEFTGDRDKLIHYLRTELQYGNATRLWDALYESIGVLKEESLRKVIVVLSDGDDLGSKLAGDEEVLTAAQDNNVMVYTIGLRNRYRGGPGGTWIESRPDGDLKKISEHTGGGFFMLTRATELNSTFSRVADELHRQYLLGVAAQTDGKPHRLDVRARVPGMTVRARKSYQASAPAK